MRRAVVFAAVCALARPPAPEGEGVRGATPAPMRLVIDNPAAAFWPNQSFWERLGGVVPARRPEPGPPVRLPGVPVDMAFDEAPFRDVLVALGRAAGVPIVLDHAVPRRIAHAPVSLAAEGVSFTDALAIVLLTVSPEGDVVCRMLGDEVRIVAR